MPIYIYACRQCGEQKEVRASLDEKTRDLNILCPKCGSTMSQVFGNVFVPGSRTGGGAPPCCGQGPSCCG